MCDPRNMQTPSRQTSAADVRARLYALLANAWRHPEESIVAALVQREESGVWPESEDALTATVTVRLRALRKACDRIRDQSGPAALEELEVAHGRLFGHSVRGTCPLYELEYGRSEIIQQTAELADLSGFYNAFGMNLQDSAFERADHLSVECEFLSVLCLKEAWGREQNRPELAETCSDAQRLFLRDHLAKWLPALAQRVMSADPDGFYGCLASLATAFLSDECRRFDIEAGPQWLDLRPADPASDAAIDCDNGGCGTAGAGDELVQIGIDRS